ncbi:GntR family transcriptional regulator [Flavimaricola marinus]|uniref:Putative HTH-type transcriptional regulator YdfH n=1 Tax=Flavimaricola marinus TaxID=1819565 RepID=A0A238LBZ9_9RHOB|nr:GntR family transcriptional regulator [Flavimaricola marinus]SMY06935.1 putative HTH-type transcriptional regulator YdfH [Flavimaricola marinus]
MSTGQAIEPLEKMGEPSVTDQVFGVLRHQILNLTLEPGTKLSEIEVARQMDVSRQPVRNAFYSLSKQGLLVIRPQRATQVSLISEPDVAQANFIRTALEAETCRIAAQSMTKDDLKVLETLIQDQFSAEAAGDKPLFHQLDDQFHQEICNRTGAPHAWEIIYESKAHVDRVRMLSLDLGLRAAIDGHVAIFDAIKARNEVDAVAALRAHLSRIRIAFNDIKASHPDWFDTDA